MTTTTPLDNVIEHANETTKAGPELINFDAVGTSTSAWAWNLISIRPASYTAPAVGKTADRGQTSNITSQSSTTVALAAGASIATGNYLIARDRKSTRLNSSHLSVSRMPSSA